MVAVAHKRSLKLKKPVVIRYASKEEVRRVARETLKQYAQALRKLAEH